MDEKAAEKTSIKALAARLVHNTGGSLRDVQVRPTGCADVVGTIANKIDARLFNMDFPKVFPRCLRYAQLNAGLELQ
jgi:hypothetical protein